MSDLVPDKQLFRVDEIAELCDVHENTVRRWIEEGQLEVIRLPGRSCQHIRIPRPVLLKILSPVQD